MVQTTTTIKDIMQSEFIKRGKNEWVNKINGKTQITDNNRSFAFIYKIMEYDSDTDEIVTEEFFNRVRLNNIDADKYFKKIFCNKFIDREIAPQTVEAFASRVTALYLQRATEITVLYEKLEDYFLGKSVSDAHDKSGYNQLTATLPQDEVNMDLTANTQDFADDNSINRAFDDNNRVSTTANPDNIAKLNKVWEEIFTTFDLSCFLQIY